MLGLSNGSPAFPRKAGFPRVIGRYGMRVACWRSRARTMRQAATAQHVRYFQRRGTGSHVSRTLRGTGTANHGLNRDRGSAAHWGCRSEEHTSELQSLMRISYAVFCLKKKKTTHVSIVLRRIIRRHTIYPATIRTHQQQTNN